MRLRSVFVIFVLSVVAESCDEETEYEFEGICCKMCPAGTRMAQQSSCKDPVCLLCAEGEYQNVYTREHLCKRQPTCNPNLNLEAQSQSKTQFSPCVCIADHHCADSACTSCVRNTECQPGQKMSKNGTQMADRVCEPCPSGTFSVHKSALTCEPWTQCSSGYKEVSPGSPTSDRICELYNLPIILSVFGILLLLVVIVLCYMFYKKGKTGSISLVQKLQRCTFWATRNTHQPVQDQDIENGQPLQPINQPQEDTEDLVKPDVPLSPGISENGMPVIQDHSKSIILSEAETEPKSFSVHL